LSGNEIEGEGLYGFVLPDLLFPEDETDGNTFRENEVVDFIEQSADYYLGEGVTNNVLYLEEE